MPADVAVERRDGSREECAVFPKLLWEGMAMYDRSGLAGVTVLAMLFWCASMQASDHFGLALKLSDNSEVSYLMSAFHEPMAAGGFRYNDPAFGIRWPLPPTVISDRDVSWPDFQTADSLPPPALPERDLLSTS